MTTPTAQRRLRWEMGCSYGMRPPPPHIHIPKHTTTVHVLAAHQHWRAVRPQAASAELALTGGAYFSKSQYTQQKSDANPVPMAATAMG